MTYQELLDELKTMKEADLKKDITVHLTEIDEFVPIHGMCIAVADECDVLDEGDIVLAS